MLLMLTTRVTDTDLEVGGLLLIRRHSQYQITVITLIINYEFPVTSLLAAGLSFLSNKSHNAHSVILGLGRGAILSDKNKLHLAWINRLVTLVGSR